MRVIRWIVSLFREQKTSDLIETGVWYPIFRNADGTAYIVVTDRRKP
jgi:hypothetical protein